MLESFQSQFFSWLTPLLIGVIAYFLYQLLQSIKDMAKDIGDIKLNMVKHSAEVGGALERISKLEEKQIQQEHNIIEFYKEYGGALDKLHKAN